jgi:hypothetical protein
MKISKKANSFNNKIMRTSILTKKSSNNEEMSNGSSRDENGGMEIKEFSEDIEEERKKSFGDYGDNMVMKNKFSINKLYH